MKYPRLKAKRAELGYSQLKVAQAIGVSLSTYCNKENGKGVFTIDEITKLMAYLKCKYEDIF